MGAKNEYLPAGQVTHSLFLVYSSPATHALTENVKFIGTLDIDTSLPYVESPVIIKYIDTDAPG